MEVSHTKKSTRVWLWIITVIMAGGFVGSYFLLILNNEAQQDAAATAEDTNLNQSQEEATKPTGPVDPTAFKTTSKTETLQVVDLAVGAGAEVKPGDQVNVHYKGTLAQSGVKFDSSYDRGEPVTLSLEGVIVGWQEGIPGMKVGGKRRLIIPSALGYGPTGNYGIPPNSDLVFEIELFAVNPAQ